MKRHLTVILIGLSFIVIIIGLSLDLYWSGMAAWGIVIVLLSIAIYCTKYIPNEENNDIDQQERDRSKK